MRRRKFIGLVGGAATAWPLAAQTAKPLRVGILLAASPSGYADRIDALRAGLRDLEYIEGKNVVFEIRSAEDSYDRLVDLATDLVRLPVDLIVTHGVIGTRAAKQATATVPIVMANSGDPVVTKLVASLAHPGGNVTGLSFFGPELAIKRLELLKEILPRMRQVAYLVNPSNPAIDVHLSGIEKAAQSWGIQVHLFNVREPAEFERAFSAMSDRHIEAVLVQDDAMIFANRGVVTASASKHRQPTASGVELSKAGGTIGYGANVVEMWRRAASYVDKILKGAKPADLAVQQPTKFEMVINLKTAKALGLEIPPLLLARADEVIE